MERESWVETFRTELLGQICDHPGPQAKGLVRKHTKRLHTTGDFSLPSLSDKVWLRFGLRPILSVSMLGSGCCLAVHNVEARPGMLAVYLDREQVFRAYFLRAEKGGKWSKTVGKSRVVNCDLVRPNSSQVTMARVASYCSALAQLPVGNVMVTSTSVEKNGQVVVRVGAILGQDGKKDETSPVAMVKERAGEAIRMLDQERREDGEDEETADTRVECLTRAFLQFSFLSASIASPVRIDFRNQQSNFVLYNNARMKRLLASFDLQVSKGIYPSVPEIHDIHFGLLTEPEEWELMFNFLLVVDDVIKESSNNLSLHKIVHFLFDLASTYSRYYNRVKTLKDPLPSLIPIVHVRILLIREVNRISENLLNILGCEPLGNM